MDGVVTIPVGLITVGHKLVAPDLARMTDNRRFVGAVTHQSATTTFSAWLDGCLRDVETAIGIARRVFPRTDRPVSSRLNRTQS